MADVDWIEYTGTVGRRKPFAITEDGSPKNITGYTITLKAWVEGAVVLTFSGGCNVTDAANGKCYYEFKVGDLPATLAGAELLVQLWLDEDAGDDYFPTEARILLVKEGAPA